MPICPDCRIGYEPTEPSCPLCKKTRRKRMVPLDHPRSEQICGSCGMFCLIFAKFASLIGAVLTLIGSVLSVFKGEWMEGVIGILIATPIAFGIYYLFRVGIHYANDR